MLDPGDGGGERRPGSLLQDALKKGANLPPSLIDARGSTRSGFGGGGVPGGGVQSPLYPRRKLPLGEVGGTLPPFDSPKFHLGPCKLAPGQNARIPVPFLGSQTCHPGPGKPPLEGSVDNDALILDPPRPMSVWDGGGGTFFRTKGELLID